MGWQRIARAQRSYPSNVDCSHRSVSQAVRFDSFSIRRGFGQFRCGEGVRKFGGDGRLYWWLFLFGIRKGARFVNSRHSSQ